MNYSDIHEHMIEKFKRTDSFVELDNVPNEAKLETLVENKVYKVPLIAIAVDIVNYETINKYSNPLIFSKVIAEYTWGVSKIMRKYGGKQITVQGNGIYCIMRSSKNPKDFDKAFKMVCNLNSFRKHIIKLVDNFYPRELRTSNYLQDNDFDFGIGVSYSFENYLSMIGDKHSRNLIFMRETINKANYLSSKAARGKIRGHILMDDNVYHNFNDLTRDRIDEIGGFKQFYDNEFGGPVWECDWIAATYDNYIETEI